MKVFCSQVEKERKREYQNQIYKNAEKVMDELFSEKSIKYTQMINELKLAAEDINNKLRNNKKKESYEKHSDDVESDSNTSYMKRIKKRNWQYKSRATNIIWFIAIKLTREASNEELYDNDRKTNYYDFVPDGNKSNIKLNYTQEMTENLMESMNIICKRVLFKYMECMVIIQRCKEKFNATKINKKDGDEQRRLRVEAKLLLIILYELDLVKTVKILKQNLENPQTPYFNDKSNKMFISKISKHLHYLCYTPYIRGMHQHRLDMKLAANKYSEVVNELLEIARNIKYVRYISPEEFESLSTNSNELITEHEFRKFNTIKRNIKHIHYYESTKKLTFNTCIRTHDNFIDIVFTDAESKIEYIFDFIELFQLKHYMTKSWEERLDEYKKHPNNSKNYRVINVKKMKITTLQYNNFDTTFPHIYIKTTGVGLNTFFYKKNIMKTNTKSNEMYYNMFYNSPISMDNNKYENMDQEEEECGIVEDVVVNPVEIKMEESMIVDEQQSNNNYFYNVHKRVNTTNKDMDDDDDDYMHYSIDYKNEEDSSGDDNLAIEDSDYEDYHFLTK